MTILKIPKLRDYLVLAVVVRELSRHQSASCLIVAFVIARFALLSCYSSAKTRIRLVKLYQEEPTETPVGVADDEPVASRTRSQTATDEPIAARTKQALGSDPEMSAFADVKDEKTLNEWLHEIAFVTSTMSDPDEPQSFQEAWWDPDLVAREKWQEAICLEFKKMLDMGVWRHVKKKDCPNDHRLVGCRWVLR